jgi:Ser/Thr protein kinase RdoA (MazF antagonist)
MARDDFESLPHEARLARLERLARAALDHWDLSSAPLSLLKYRENAIFQVTRPDSGEHFVLRVHRAGYHDDAEIRSELQWMAALNEAGVGAPHVVPAASGELFVTVQHAGVPQPRQCDLLRWVEGRIIGDIQEGYVAEADEIRSSYRLTGELAARIHEHGQRWPQPRGFKRPHMDFDGLIGERAYLGPYSACTLVTPARLLVLDRAKEVIRGALTAFGKASDRYGLTHGDFLPENLLRDGDTIRIIDFDDCGFGWHVMDVATSLMFLVGEPMYEPAFEGFVEGYRSVRPLPDEHLEMLPVFFLARAMTYIGWCGSRPETPIAQEIGPWLVESTVAAAEQFLAQVS